MEKKDKLKILALFCWFTLIPFIYQMFTHFLVEKLRSPGFSVNFSFNFELIILIYGFFTLVCFILLMWLWIKSLVKLIYYRNDLEKKIIYKRKLVHYSAFLITIFLSHGIFVLLNSIYVPKIEIPWF